MGRTPALLLLLCVVSGVVPHARAGNPYFYLDQQLPGENQPFPLPLQHAPVKFRSDANDNILEASTVQAYEDPFTLKDMSSGDSTVKESVNLADPSQLTSTFKSNVKYSKPQRIDDNYAFLTPSLPSYQHSQFRSVPSLEEVTQPFNTRFLNLKNESPDKPIAVVPFKPPKRKPNKIVFKPLVSPSLPEPSMAPTESTFTPQPVPSAPYAAPSAPYAAPYAAPSAPYAAPSAPYAAPSAPYAAPSAPYAAASPPAPMNINSFNSQVKGIGGYAPSFPDYLPEVPGSEGDFRSGLFLGDSDTPVPESTLIFTKVHGRGLFDAVDDREQFKLGSGSYYYLSPENVPVYMLDIYER